MTGVCDVLVVGLGPGGAAAAWAAARRGLHVIAVERKRQIGVPVQCAEFIPIPVGRFARSQGILKQHVAGMQSVLPSGEVRRSSFPGYMIDRAAFDQGLAAMAEESGAEIRVHTVLEELDPDAGTARVRDADGWHVIRFKLLIAADGPISKVGDLLGLPRQKVVHSRQYTVPLLCEMADTTIWLSGEYPGGYAWLFPRGAEANLGIGIDYDYSRDAKHPLDKLHDQLAAQGTVGGEIRRRTGGAIPVGGMREKLALDRIMFVGDAAGLTHPITGAGIAAAVMSGERAGEAAAEYFGKGAGALADYDEEIRDIYGPTIERALRVRESLSWIWQTAAADDDATQRRGWIAFEEYFAF
jgi:geranylgeranyl reductase family protein